MEHDLIVIGGGPGGYATALYAAAAGMDVGLVEKNKLGGTCLHVGCIPAKELLETASVYRTVSEASEFGVTASEPELDMAVAQKRKQSIIDKLTKGVEGMLKHRKVAVYSGVGELAGAAGASGKNGSPQNSSGQNSSASNGSADSPLHQIRVSAGIENETLVAPNVVLASGSVPRSLPLPGFDFDGKTVINSDHLLSIKKAPPSAIIIGGGAIGCEFASLLGDFGTQVTLLEALPQLLPGADPDVSKFMERSFKKRKIDVQTGVSVVGCERTDSGVSVKLEGSEPVEATCVIVAIGRRPLSESLSADKAGVKIGQGGYVAVDEFCRTSVPGIYAVGDLVATPQLAHVGFAEGMLAVGHMLGESPEPISYGHVPWGIYTRPEVAFAGLTEPAAVEAGYEVVTSTHRFGANSRAMIIGEAEGLVKVVAEKKADGSAGLILGVHIVGPWATELLGQAYLTVNWEAEADDVAGLIQPHPTLSELYGEAMLSLTGRPLHG